MGFVVEIKGVVALVSFPDLEEDRRNLAAEVTALLSTPDHLVAFDFTALDKIDFHLLREMEPAAKAIRTAGRSYAVCCKDPAIQAVLETAGLLAGADLFASSGELLRFMARKTGQSKPAASSRKRSVWSGLFRVRYDFHTLGFGVVILLLLVGGIQNMFLSCSVRRLSARVEELTFLSQDADKEPAPIAPVASAATGKAGTVRPEMLQTVRRYNEASRSLRRSAQSFLDAQRSFYHRNSRFASSIDELGWAVEPSVEITGQRSIPSGELVRIELTRNMDAGRSLKWEADVRSGLHAIP